MLSSTSTRVPEHTSSSVNSRLREDAIRRVAKSVARGTGEVERRLKELDSEWDIERALQTHFALVTAAVTALGLLVDRRWFLFSTVSAALMLQHALQGWCPPLPVMRRLGFRSAAEIQQERSALKALRGDFASAKGDPENAVLAARM